jgi:hypothetical protein
MTPKMKSRRRMRKRRRKRRTKSKATLPDWRSVCVRGGPPS